MTATEGGRAEGDSAGFEQDGKTPIPFPDRQGHRRDQWLENSQAMQPGPNVGACRKGDQGGMKGTLGKRAAKLHRAIRPTGLGGQGFQTGKP
jgi:hypothetical protein